MYHTCASFIRRKIVRYAVRYAESQAVYTICVLARDVFEACKGTNNNNNHLEAFVQQLVNDDDIQLIVNYVSKYL